MVGFAHFWDDAWDGLDDPLAQLDIEALWEEYRRSGKTLPLAAQASQTAATETVIDDETGAVPSLDTALDAVLPAVLPTVSGAQSVIDYLAGLNPEQLEAATCLKGPLAMIAAAGTGKTKTLVHRTAMLMTSPETQADKDRILIVTFSSKAAKEFQDRLTGLLGPENAPKNVGTFHRMSGALLRQYPEIAGLTAQFKIADPGKSEGILRKIMDARGMETQALADERDPVSVMLGAISVIKDAGYLPEEAQQFLAESGRTTEEYQKAAELYPIYQQALREADLADFADLVLWPVRRMEADDEMRKAMAAQYDYIMVDEYQDTNDVQYRWLKMLASEHKNMAICGDDDQAIYEWRSAKPEYIRRFTEDFPGAKEVYLLRNYRSTPQILKAANKLISVNQNRMVKEMIPGNEENGPEIAVRHHRTAVDEAMEIARTIKRLPETVKRHDIAVLVRAGHQSRVLEDAMRACDVPFLMVGGFSFYRRAEVRRMLELLRIATDPYGEETTPALKRALGEHVKGLGSASIQAMAEYAETNRMPMIDAIYDAERKGLLKGKKLENLTAFVRCIEAAGAEATVEAMVNRLFTDSGYRDKLATSKKAEDAERLENVQELIGLAKTFHSAHDLIEFVEEADREEEQYGTDRVQIMTMHKSKGLEFRHVFLPSWGEGMFPSTRRDGEEEEKMKRLEEERRLAYVGITRAKWYLTVSWHESNDRSERKVGPSRFLIESGLVPDPNAGVDMAPDEDADIDLDEIEETLAPAPGF